MWVPNNPTKYNRYVITDPEPFSRPPPSTTRPSLRAEILLNRTFLETTPHQGSDPTDPPRASTYIRTAFTSMNRRGHRCTSDVGAIQLTSRQRDGSVCVVCGVGLSPQS